MLKIHHNQNIQFWLADLFFHAHSSECSHFTGCWSLVLLNCSTYISGHCENEPLCTYSDLKPHIYISRCIIYSSIWTWLDCIFHRSLLRSAFHFFALMRACDFFLLHPILVISILTWILLKQNALTNEDYSTYMCVSVCLCVYASLYLYLKRMHS